ncbi:leucine-rich repeat domain-containing protein [Treponema sp.]|uniref:leucine-rich repeat domain-containing protein n=1 Tax=Treponema sp. TaxID=166 RepID=UPI00298E0E27|nr:leucine-rich repeat domain-containing protein [Treponema sp.]MCQ2241991.1 leucine-rich repeat domain-containing protein [Treponema sp.]
MSEYVESDDEEFLSDEEFDSEECLEDEESDEEEFDNEEFLEDEEYEDDEVLDGTDDEEESEFQDEEDEDDATVEGSDIFEIKKNVLTWIDPSVSGRVVIPSGVTRISTAFNNLMTEVVLPNTVKIISKYAFHRCTNLEKINIPASVKKIGEGAFADCKKLKDVVFEERTDSIEFGLYVFCDCRALENPILPEGITEIPDRLFSIFISSIQLPSTIEKVGTFLATCQELMIYYNGTVEQWKELASDGKVGPLARRKIICNDGELGTLKHSHPSKKWMCIDGNTVVMCVTGATGVVVVPDYVKKIMDHAFSDCKKITEIRLGEGVTQICSGAFSNCTGLKKVFIPKGIRRLGKNLFKGCKTVEIVYGGTEGEWDAMDHSGDGTGDMEVSYV